MKGTKLGEKHFLKTSNPLYGVDFWQKQYNPDPHRHWFSFFILGKATIQGTLPSFSPVLYCKLDTAKWWG